MYSTAWVKTLSHMRFSFIDSLAPELEFPKQKHWPQPFYEQTLREKGIHELSTVFFTNRENAKETQSMWKLFVSPDKLILNRHFNLTRAFWGLNLKLRKKKTCFCDSPRHFWHIISYPFVEFVIIRNKWRHSFCAQCAHWHGNECFPPIIHQFNAWMWPSMWIFDRSACFPYLHPSHTLSLSHTICISLFLSLDFSPRPSSDFRNFPWELFKY